MPPVSHPFKQGALVVLMNYNDHAPHTYTSGIKAMSAAIGSISEPESGFGPAWHCHPVCEE